MFKITFLLFLSFSLSFCISAESTQKEQYTVKKLADGAYNIEDTNDSNPAEMGTFTRISQKKDYALTVTRLVLDLGENSIVTNKDLTEGIFEVLGINKSDKTIRNISSLSVTDKRGFTTESGRYITINLDFAFDTDAENAYIYTVLLNKDLGEYMKSTEFIQQGRTLRR